MANETIKLIENTISIGKKYVVSRKWYQKGYFIEEGGVLAQIQFVQADDNLCAAVYVQLVADILKMQDFEFAGDS